MDKARVAAELLDIEHRARDGAPPAEEEERWTHLIKQLIRRLQQESGERRRCLRIPLDDVEVTFERNHASATMTATDVSNGGVSISGLEEGRGLRAGDVVDLTSIRMQGKDYPQRLPCQVAWVAPQPEAHSAKNLGAKAIGLAFVGMTPERRNLFFPCYYKAYSGFLNDLARAE